MSLKEKTVLVAEDDNTSRLLVKLILERNQIGCLEAKNGDEAIKILESQACDFLLTDMQMPVLCGLGLIKAVRESEKNTNKPQLPIIILSAGVEDMTSLLEQYSINGYLTKPVFEDKLIPLLQDIER